MFKVTQNKIIKCEIKTGLLLLIFPLFSDPTWLNIALLLTLHNLNVAVTDPACLISIWEGNIPMSATLKCTKKRWILEWTEKKSSIIKCELSNLGGECMGIQCRILSPFL